MTKVLYNGEYIELEDELEEGYKELELLMPKKTDLDDTMELKKINFDDTQEFNFDELENTKEIDLGELNG